MAILLLAAPSPGADVYLVAKQFTVTMPDSTVVTMWGFASATAGFASVGTPTVPGPRITVPPGDTTLNVHLRNDLPNASDGVSVVIPGQTAALAPERTGVRATSFTTATPGAGGQNTYGWTGLRPGSYPYHSGTHAAVQVQMGLYGPVTVQPAAQQAYPGIAYDNEAILFYSEIDPALHQAVADGDYGTPTYPSTIDYVPKYFLVNGQPHPGAAPILDHPILLGERVLVRFFNQGLRSHVPTLEGGAYMSLIAEDGNVYPYPREQYSTLLPAGKTIDALLTAPRAGMLPVYDRALSLTNDEASPGGMLTFANVGVNTLDRRVSASSDDAEESSSGSMDLSSSDLELVQESSLQTVGIRFRNVPIAQGAPISRAYVQFQVDETDSGDTPLTIQGQASGDAPGFSSSSMNISNRPRTVAQVSWSPSPWQTVGIQGPDQQTEDITSIVQEIVSRGDWNPGNALVIIITGSGKRVAESYDGVPAGAPLLHVEYGVVSAAAATVTTTTSTSTTTTSLPSGAVNMYQAGLFGPANSANVDTYIRRSSAGSNFGTSSSVYVGVTDGSTRIHRAIAAFDISDIPAGATVTACSLTVYVSQRTNPTAGRLSRLCGEHWLDGNGQSETQATWNRWRSGMNWTTAGAGSTAPCASGGDYSTTGEVPYTPPGATGFFTFPDITALCQDALGLQGGWLRLRISQDAEGTQNRFMRFNSSEHSTTSRRPKLTVSWSLGGSTTTTTTTVTTVTATTSTTTTTAPVGSTTTTTTAVATTSTSTSTTTPTTVAPTTTATVTTTSTTTPTTLPPGGPTTNVYQQGVSGPANSANIDTKVRLSQATTNFGTDPELHVGVTNGADKVYRTFMAFDLGDIPAGAVVTSCTLRINVTQRTNPTPGHIRRLCGEHWLDGNAQGESQATWNVWKTGFSWGTPGAGSTAPCASGGDYTTTDEVAYTPPGGTGLFTFPDIATLCQDAIAQRGGWLRLRISQDSESTQSNLIRFDSSDVSSASNRPRLSVTWFVP
jgi:hypothetical protein